MPISLEWLAGFLDGEGCITISGGKKQTYLYVEVCQCNYKIIKEIQSEYGGHMYSKKPRSEKHSQGWTLRWVCNDGVTILQKLRPYLRIKQEQATIILEEWVPLLLPKDRHGPGKGLTETEKSARLEVKSKIHTLNTSIN